MIKLMMICSVAMLFSVVDDKRKLREYYSLVSKEEVAVNNMRALSLKSETVPKPIRNAYYAAAEMCSAQYKFSPTSKISAFNRGKALLEAAIALDTTAVESRYIRFTIQENAPAFLGYNKSIKSDRVFILSQLSRLRSDDPELYAIIYAYFLAKSPLTQKEKALL